MNSQQPPNSDSAPQTGQTEANSGVTSIMFDRSELAVRPGLAIAMGLLSAAVAVGAVSTTYPTFQLSDALLAIASNETASPEDLSKLRAGEFAVGRNNALLVMTLVGVCLGGGLGLAEGVARRSAVAIVIMSCFVLLMGALFGGIGGVLGHSVYTVLRPVEPGATLALGRTIVWQAIMLAPLGLGIALGLTLPLRNPVSIMNGILGGVFGGVLAALVVPPLAAVVMIDTDTELLIPSQTKLQILWLAALGLLLAVGITGMGNKKGKQASAAK